MFEEFYDKEEIKELQDIIDIDTYQLSPEIGVRYNSLHQGLNKVERPISNAVDFPADIATRYYEDKEYARAYALMPYECGIAIFCKKKTNSYTILVLGEDDGAWFISRQRRLDWIQRKSNFIALVAEALGIFNNNYKSE